MPRLPTALLLAFLAAPLPAAQPAPATPPAPPAPPAPATRPAAVTLHLAGVPAPAALKALADQCGAPLPPSPPDLFEKNPRPAVTLDVSAAPFWEALRQLNRQTGLEPVLNPDDPYPRFQVGLGAGNFFKPPCAVAGPLFVAATDMARTATVELGKSPARHRQERSLTLSLALYAEPGLRVLAVADDVRVLEAVDDRGHSLVPPPQADAPVDPPGFSNPGGGLYTWAGTADLHCPPDVGTRITRFKGQARLRVQARSQRVEFADVLKARNLTRTVAGAPVTFKSLKKADVEYVLALDLRRDQVSETQWEALHNSVFNGMMALYDDNGRLVAARATENGGDYGERRIDATLRFVREPGVSDPTAGEPARLVWDAPTATRDLTLDFVLTDLPIPP